MATIKIPSKKIYDNPKHGLSKNYINKVEAKENKLDFIKDFDVVVGTRQIDVSQSYKDFPLFTARDFKGSIAGTGQNIIYGEMRRASTYTTYFSRKTENGKRDVVYLAEKQPNASVLAKKTTKTYEFDDFEFDYNRVTDTTQVPTEEFVLSIFPNKTCTVTEEDVYEIPQTYEQENASIDWGAYPTQSAEFEGNRIKSIVSYYRVYAKIKSCHNWIDKIDAKIWVKKLTYVEYIPKELSFSVKGDVEEYKDASENKSHGGGNDYFKMSTNELMQKNAELDGIPVVDANANAIISEYKNGKETYELLCSVGEYKDILGKKAVSVTEKIGGKTKMLFDIGDTVIPYKSSAAGDVAISKMRDGKSPKLFKVVGVTPIFDGAVWQRLSLLEEGGRSQVVATTKYVPREAHTFPLVDPIVLLSTRKQTTIALGDSVKEVYYGSIKIPTVGTSADGEQIEKVYSDDKNYFIVKAGILEGTNELIVNIQSATTDYEGSGIGLLITYSGVTKAVEPQDLVFDLYMY